VHCSAFSWEMRRAPGRDPGSFIGQSGSHSVPGESRDWGEDRPFGVAGNGHPSEGAELSPRRDGHNNSLVCPESCRLLTGESPVVAATGRPRDTPSRCTQLDERRVTRMDGDVTYFYRHKRSLTCATKTI
jgi:hypothetical protein